MEVGEGRLAVSVSYEVVRPSGFDDLAIHFQIIELSLGVHCCRLEERSYEYRAKDEGSALGSSRVQEWMDWRTVHVYSSIFRHSKRRSATYCVLWSKVRSLCHLA